MITTGQNTMKYGTNIATICLILLHVCKLHKGHRIRQNIRRIGENTGRKHKAKYQRYLVTSTTGYPHKGHPASRPSEVRCQVVLNKVLRRGEARASPPPPPYPKHVDDREEMDLQVYNHGRYSVLSTNLLVKYCFHCWDIFQ